MHRKNAVPVEFRFDLHRRLSGILVADYIVPVLSYKGHPGVLGVLEGNDVKRYYTLQQQLQVECAQLEASQKAEEFSADDWLLFEFCDLVGRHVQIEVRKQFRVLVKKPFTIREGWKACREDLTVPERAAEAYKEAQSPKVVRETVSTRSEHVTVGNVLHSPPSARLNI